MAENKMKQVAELLGVEMGVPFKIKDNEGVLAIYNPYMLKDDFLYDRDYHTCPMALNYLLNGIYEIEKPILDDVEKRYLESVLRPFKDSVKTIEKVRACYSQFISISIKNERSVNFPYFRRDSMYIGMEEDKEYTLQELGLFEDD